MALVVPFVVLVIGGILYTNFVQQQADRQWCELIVTLDQAYQAEPPQTELGQRIAAAMHQLREEFDCRGGGA